jgi:arylsulfatase A-like enzyme
MINKVKHTTALLTLASAFALVGCQKLHMTTPLSMIVIAVDRLSQEEMVCAQDQRTSLESGFLALCRESIRFSHAFTTSTRSGPALTSMLTGMIPPEHGLQFTSGQYVSSQIQLISESLFQNGWRTALFSGGAPILRHQNLHQGFEVFDEPLNFSPHRSFRPFNESVDIYLDWLEEFGPKKHFAVFYVPDLNFIDHPTMTSLGDPRNFTYDSQLEEFDERLGAFFSHLKKKGRWQNSLIVLVGLNGRTSFSQSAYEPLNLRSSQTQVSLIIKPPQVKTRDEPLNWSLDQNVSLQDLAPTILQAAGLKYPQSEKLMGPKSLYPSLFDIGNPLEPNRWIYSEGTWLFPSDERAKTLALRNGQILFFWQDQLRIFNSLIDRQENLPLTPNDEALLELKTAAQTLIKADQLKDLPGPKNANITNESESLQTIYWFALDAMKKLDQRWLLNQVSELSEFKMKQYLGFLNKRSPVSDLDPCIQFALIPESKTLKAGCKDSQLRRWVADLSSKTDLETAKPGRTSVLAYYHFLSDQKAVEMDRKFAGAWDVSSKMIRRLIRQQMILNLPPYKILQPVLQKEAQQIRK